MARVSTWSADQQELLKNPRALEVRCGVEPLENLLRTGSGLIGVSRLIVEPSFGPATLLTLQYGADGVHVEVVRPKVNLWYALEGGGPAWEEPSREMAQFKVGDLPELLQDFERLKAASENAPTVTRMIVNGQAYITLDGTPYRHYLRDFSDELSARWCPLAPEAENQQGQLRLVEAYMALLEML